MNQIVVLGSTGSIGRQTLEVVDAHPDRLVVVGLSAHSQWKRLMEQSRRYRPRWVVLTDPDLAGLAGEDFDGAAMAFGSSGLNQLVTEPDVDTVVAAVVGAAGLESTLAALEAGKKVALANKEALVVAGALVIERRDRHQGVLVPIDSEHSAIWQCLSAGRRAEVARVILTASGGPFRTTPLERFDDLSVEQALDHPTWRMGPKITIDSATMMNKALEIIEAHWLFGLDADQIEVVIHPQSMIHSLVEFVDGSVVAQISPPDMRLPIQYALTYPDRLECPATKVDVSELGRWDFFEPDPARYPALELGYEVVRRGGTAGAALNAANEVAVARFLDAELPFAGIARLARHVLDRHPYHADPQLADLVEVDRWARQEARRWKPSTTYC